MAVSAPRQPVLLEQAREVLGAELFERVVAEIRAELLVEDPRYLVDRSAAAWRLSVSLSHFQRHMQPHLPCVYSGQLRLYRPADLEAYAEKQTVQPGERR